MKLVDNLIALYSFPLQLIPACAVDLADMFGAIGVLAASAGFHVCPVVATPFKVHGWSFFRTKFRYNLYCNVNSKNKLYLFAL